MTANAIKKACHRFAEAAAPYLRIQDARHYEEALSLIESLMEEAGNTPDDPLNAVIDLLARAIEDYESLDADLAVFETRTMEPIAGLALLRLLMDQYDLGVADLPEIGSKSMVSRVLCGQRELSKRHITALSERFGIDPARFF